jgi:hypothetical protein
MEKSTLNNLTLCGEFDAGMESGKKPCKENTDKAIGAVASRITAPLVRAYWSGYLCQAQTDNSSFFQTN